MGSSRPMLPAQYVPEELISQAQVVLQGRSRNLIIRELQVELPILIYFQNMAGTLFYVPFC